MPGDAERRLERIEPPVAKKHSRRMNRLQRSPMTATVRATERFLFQRVPFHRSLRCKRVAAAGFANQPRHLILNRHFRLHNQPIHSFSSKIRAPICSSIIELMDLDNGTSPPSLRANGSAQAPTRGSSQ